MNASTTPVGMPDLLALAAPAPPATAPAAFLSRPVPGESARSGCGVSRDLREFTQAICAGDEAAFAEFYDLYSLRLYKHLLLLTRGNEGEARDVLQTVVVKVASRFQVFDEERRLWGWLCRIARNACVDRARAQRRDRRLVPLHEHAPELAQVHQGDHRLAASLHHALEKLTDEEQELMRAAYVDERPLQELAEASGQTYKAVESRLGRLRRKLKTQLLHHLRHEDES